MTELTPEQQKEKKREMAIIRLKNDFFRGLAAAKVGTWQDYGTLLEDIRARTISEYSDGINGDGNKLAYQELIAPRLGSDSSLEEHAFKLLAGSLGDIKVKDYFILTDMGSQPKQGYADKLISELEDDEKKAIVSGYFQNLADSVARKTLGARIEARKKTLVDMLCEPEQPSRK